MRKHTSIFDPNLFPDHLLCRHAIEQGTFIHRLAFSPAHNLLAWTDSAGIFTRWPDVIPPTAPSPIKPAPSAGMSVPVRRQVTPLFGQDDDTTPAKENADVDAEIDADLEERDDDWIIDDIGDGLQEKEEKEYAANGPREMGIRNALSKMLRSNCFSSERHKGSENFPAWLYTVPEQAPLPLLVDFHVFNCIANLLLQHSIILVL